MSNNNENSAKANAESDKNRNEVNDKKKIKTKIIFLVLGGLLLGYFLGVEMGFRFIVPYVYDLKTEAILKDYAKPYMEDVIGGNTPEETIDLFIEALKKEDMVLASKYFIVGKQDKVLSDLSKIDILKSIEELEFAQKNWKKEIVLDGEVSYWYNTIRENIEMTNKIYLIKNTNNKWKIKNMYIFYITD